MLGDSDEAELVGARPLQEADLPGGISSEVVHANHHDGIGRRTTGFGELDPAMAGSLARQRRCPTNPGARDSSAPELETQNRSSPTGPVKIGEAYISRSEEQAFDTELVAPGLDQLLRFQYPSEFAALLDHGHLV